MTFSPQTVVCSGLPAPSHHAFPKSISNNDDDDDNLQVGKGPLGVGPLTCTDVNPKTLER